MKKKTYKKSYNRIPRTAHMGLVSSPRLMVSLPYSDVYTVPSSANPAAQVWRINSIFDPDLTGVGHQPLGTDQYALLYSKYQVHGCKLDIKVISDTAVSFNGVIVASDTDSSSATVLVAQEDKLATPFSIGPIGARNVYHFKKYFAMKQIHGKKRIDQIDDLAAAVGANPVDPIYAWIKVAAYDNATTAKIYYNVRLTYYVEFFDPINPAQS